MTAPRECRPPDGTQDGTVCVLRVNYEFARGPVTVDKRWTWTGDGWIINTRTAGKRILSVEGMTEHGWHFHSIAEPPHG